MKYRTKWYSVLTVGIFIYLIDIYKQMNVALNISPLKLVLWSACCFLYLDTIGFDQICFLFHTQSGQMG